MNPHQKFATMAEARRAEEARLAQAQTQSQAQWQSPQQPSQWPQVTTGNTVPGQAPPPAYQPAPAAQPTLEVPAAFPAPTPNSSTNLPFDPAYPQTDPVLAPYVPQTEPATQTQSAQPPQENPDLAEVRRQLAAENAEIQRQRELERIRREIDQRLHEEERQRLSKELETYRAQATEEEIERALDFNGVEFEQLTPDEAKKIVRPVYERLVKRQDQKWKELDERNAELRRSFEEYTKATQMAQLEHSKRQWHAAIEAEVPNVGQVLSDPDFKAYLQSPIYPGSKTKRYTVLRQEYEAFNTQPVVAMIKDYLASRTPPSLESVTQVASASPSGVRAPEEKKDASEDERREWYEKVRIGQMSRDEYRRRLHPEMQVSV